MPAPEINVRLTADGVQDVVNAFKRVQQESRNTKSEIGLLGEAMGQLGDLLPAISIGAAVTGMVQLGKSAMDSVVSIGKLSQETGASAGTLSVLTMAAHDVGVSQDQMGQSLVRLGRNMENASNGSAQSQKAFQSLGISMADIKSKNPGDMFVEIAQKLQAMPDGATKSAVAMQLFGRSGAQLIPVLNEIGQNNGFDTVQQKAQALGLYFSDDMVADAKSAEEAIRNMQDVTKGFALQFMSGFMPEATGALTDFTKTVTGSGTNAFKIFGDFVGNVVRGIVNVFLVAGQTIAVVWTSVMDGVVTTTKTIGSSIDQLKNGNIKGAWDALKSGVSDTLARQGSMWSTYGSMVKNEYTSQPQTASLPKATGGGKGGSGNGESLAQQQKAEKEREKLIDARAAYQDTVDNAELQKQKLRDQEVEAEDKARYDAGLTTLDEYYDAREERINAEADTEEAILNKKLADQESAAAKLMNKSQDYVKSLLQQGPAAIEAAAGTNTQALAMLQKVAQTKAQIDEDEIKRQTQLQQNETQRQQAQKQADAQELTDRQRLYELEGNTNAAQQVALQKELQEMDQLLQKQGVATADRQTILAGARTNAMARNQMGTLSQSGSAAMTDLQTGVSEIQAKASAGAISELDAEAQIYGLEEKRLPILQSIAQQMQTIIDGTKAQLASAEAQLSATKQGSDAYKTQATTVDNLKLLLQSLQEDADGYTKGLNTLKASLQTTTSFSVELSNQLTTQGVGAAVSFFDAINTGSKSASDAFADLGKSFEQIITHMIDQMIVYYTMMALVGWIAPNSNLYTSLSKSSPFSGLTGHQEGGYTGNTSVNQITGFVHGQEFVSTAQATSKYRPLLEAMNAGTVSSIATGSTYSSFGGTTGSGTGDNNALVQVNVQNNSGQQVSTNQRTGAGGQSIIDIVVGQVASDIASGGKVGQTIQSTYNLSRKGIIRG